jgi:hypothetical protein
MTLSDLLLEHTLSGTLLAYVGPGPGLSMLGALLALVATLVVCCSAIALWPIRALRRQWRQKRSTLS